jgi:hypothetical protein
MRWDENKKKYKFGDQMLSKRLHTTQDGVYRQEFFTDQVSEHERKLEIHWFVTCDDHGHNGLLPAKVEADLMQAFFEDMDMLPEWNNSFRILSLQPSIRFSIILGLSGSKCLRFVCAL